MVKLQVRDRESIQDAVRRFRKLVERSGIKKEMRRLREAERGKASGSSACGASSQADSLGLSLSDRA